MSIEYCGNKVEKILSVKIPSNKLLVPKVSNDFFDFLHSNQIEGCDAFRVAFEEALTNAIVHGNKNDYNKNVSIDFYINDEMIKVVIEDEGDGFDYFSAMICLTESQDNIYKDSGRGIFLISLYTDDFYFEDNGRKIIIIKNRS
ncbi:ATP-binding protein [Brachyspira hyodysenteriae]|uniref:ATP-binding protein n=1 Tax=Brachyspira hyodysenteriae TaxID=159 RepID=UPI000C78E731|nr:ATP-binding protein [Brachyspira hyodysenteriae]AUJ49743.1 anti-sigma factor [Brachyspira hyodysenteriae]MCZ9956079.1 ATP-binding protein [Brachyspira hyodysenteriae]MDA0034813.1 ATP-binding protein [Brachyspira hyodysenteriae]MDA0048888.1 ATP-binding protein [Brachyspira hyodysenteriae]MDA1469578.1 ATP-binding protein [Brachyspira hyodysenteriae]